MIDKKESEVEGGRCVLVGTPLDANGRELLNCTLGNVTKEGDRVIALHISHTSDLGHSITQSSIKALDDFLAEFEGLCTLKQVALVGRVSRGTSIKKALVKEAVLCAASVVVVGATSKLSLGGSASNAKYCSKKLPLTVSLIGFHNGKVFFERESIQPPSGKESRTNLRSILHPNVGMDTEAIIPKSQAKPDHGHCEKKTIRRDPSNVSILVRKLPEEKPGWPLLRKKVAANMEALKDSEARKMSVVQWVMKLPNRSLLLLEAAPFDITEELNTVLQKTSTACKWFQYEELRSSTNGFSSENLIGNGGSSQVYKGCLPDGQQVAIKLSKLSKATSRDFLLEVEIIANLQHERIRPLLGVCIEDRSFLSIYGYFSKGSLEENLHGKKAKPPLDWNRRFKIAVGVAEALSYLHNGSTRAVIHRDVKSSNILLSDEFEPQLSDFGLAVWARQIPYSNHTATL